MNPQKSFGASAPHSTPRTRRTWVSVGGMRWALRSVIVAAMLLVVLAGLVVAALMVGDYPIGPGQVVGAIFGTEHNALINFYVVDLRAPRVVLAVLVGIALGVSGAIFQSVTGNPLGSPDITGFSVGAATGALLQILLFQGGPVAIALGAVGGGLATGAVVYFLARTRGMSGTRFVLVGIGVSFILQGVNSLLVVQADLTSAQTAAQWLAGSLNATTWGETYAMLAVVILAIPACVLLTGPMNMMESRDELAVGLGVNVARRRRELLAVGVVLVAVSVAATGPIAFVALAAPQVARRIAKGPSASLGLAGLTGAVLVVASDIAAQRLFAPTQLPVGVITGSLGGAYLIWLLIREWRRA